MNKNILYVVAALVGVGAAVLLFGLSGPDGDGFGGGDDIAQVDGSKGKGKGPKAKAKRKDIEASNPNPFAAEASKNLTSSFGVYCRNAAPAFMNLAMELNNEDQPDLSKVARKEAARLRKERRKSDVDWAAILVEERELLKNIEATGPNESAVGSIEQIRALMGELETSGDEPEEQDAEVTEEATE